MWSCPRSWCRVAAVSSSQTRDHEGKQLLHWEPFCSSLSVQYSINYMRYSTLAHKTGSVLDDFAQPYADVSVLSMFKVGRATLWCRFGALNAFSTYDGIIRRWCHHKSRWIFICIHTCICINVLPLFFLSVCVLISLFFIDLYYNAHKVLGSA